MGLTISQILTIMCVPSAITGFCFWCLKRSIDKMDKERERKECARERCEFLIIKNTRAAIALGEATARAVQRIPDAHCNGDMKKALAYAEQVKHEQKDFLAEQGIHNLYE